MLAKKVEIDGYLVGEENPVLFILLSRVNPRVAYKVDPTVARNVAQCDRPQIELAMMVVFYHESLGESDGFVPVECDLEGGFTSS